MRSYFDIGRWAFGVCCSCSSLAPILTPSLLISAEDNVFLCPGMNTPAVCAGELLCFYFGRLPALFCYRPSGIGQL